MPLQKIKSLSMAKLLTLACIFLSACATNGDQRFAFNNNELTIQLSDKEVIEAEESLRAATDGKIPRGMQGGILIEGCLLTAPTVDYNGQRHYIIKYSHIYQGEAPTKDYIELISPRIENGGVDIAPNLQYKIFAVRLDETSSAYYIWRGTVIRSN